MGMAELLREPALKVFQCEGVLYVWQQPVYLNDGSCVLFLDVETSFQLGEYDAIAFLAAQKSVLGNIANRLQER